MKYCSHCGSTVGENDNFCQNCGEKIELKNNAYSQNRNYEKNSFNNRPRSRDGDVSPIGALSLVFTFILPLAWLGFILTLIGLLGEYNYRTKKTCRVALVFQLLFIGIIVFVLYMSGVIR